MKKVLLNKIQNIAPDRVLINEPMSKHTTFGIGGAAACFIYPEREHLKQLLKIAHDHSIPIFFMGSGSNLLVSDKGFDGIVVSFAKSLKKLVFRKANCFSCESGVMLGHLVKEVSKRGIGGMEGLIGVPGTVGGGIRMNSGCFNREFKDILISVQAIDKFGKILTIPGSKIKFIYRGCGLPEDLIFLSATFKGIEKSKKLIEEEVIFLKKKKEKAQPNKIKTGGSTFKNPIDQTHKKVWEIIKESVPLDVHFGDAAISQKHCNFFVNKKNANYNDMKMLINFVKDKVMTKTGIRLELEVVLVE